MEQSFGATVFTSERFDVGTWDRTSPTFFPEGTTVTRMTGSGEPYPCPNPDTVCSGRLCEEEAFGLCIAALARLCATIVSLGVPRHDSGHGEPKLLQRIGVFEVKNLVRGDNDRSHCEVSVEGIARRWKMS
jgi:hypothetical protein